MIFFTRYMAILECMDDHNMAAMGPEKVTDAHEHMGDGWARLGRSDSQKLL